MEYLFIIVISCFFIAEIIKWIKYANNWTTSVLVLLIDNAYLWLFFVFMLVGMFFIRVYQTSSKGGRNKLKLSEWFRYGKDRESGEDIKVKDYKKDVTEKMDSYKGKTVNMEKGLDGTHFDPFSEGYPSNEYYENIMNSYDKLMGMLDEHFENPEKFKDILTGWFHNLGTKRISKAVNEFNSLLENTRKMCRNRAEFEAELVRYRYIYKFLISTEMERIRKNWEEENEVRKLRETKRATEKARLLRIESESLFFKNFFDRLTEKYNKGKEFTRFEEEMVKAKLIISSTRTSSVSSNNAVESENIEYLNISELFTLDQKSNMLKTQIDDIKESIDLKKAQKRNLDADTKKKNFEANIQGHEARLQKHRTDKKLNQKVEE